MKRFLSFTSLLVLAFFAALTTTVSAQSTTDTVYIPGAQSLQISNIINADTSVTAPRVYVLDRGAIYYIEAAFEINSSCKFIATGSAARPPILAPAIRADNSSEEWFFKLIQTGINVELNDLYLLSMRSDGQTLGWSRAIHIGADNISVKLRRVVFDAFTEVGIRADGAFVKLDVQDCHFRNLMHSSAYFGGQPFLSNGSTHPDTTIFINNTFFACNSYLFSIRGRDKHSVFEHNTVVYGVVNPFLVNLARNLHLNNNLFYAAHAWGGDPEQTIGGWFFNDPDTASSAIFHIWQGGSYFDGNIELPGPEVYNDTAKGLIFDPSQRVVVAQNNAYHYPNKLVKFYNDWNDTVTVYDSVNIVTGPKQYLKRTLNITHWMNDAGLETLDSLTNPTSSVYSPYVSVANNIDSNPEFNDAGVTGHIDELIGYVNRIASRGENHAWHYELNFPPKWPLPENLAYTNSSLINGGTDGYALGDLNWFPDQKNQWVTGVEEIDAELPSGFSLSQNYPNPFNPETNIKFSIASSGIVKIVIYNILGQKVKTLLNQEMNVGTYATTWNGTDELGNKVASGTYLLSLETSSFRTAKKMVLLK